MLAIEEEEPTKESHGRKNPGRMRLACLITYHAFKYWSVCWTTTVPVEDTSTSRYQRLHHDEGSMAKKIYFPWKVVYRSKNTEPIESTNSVAWLSRLVRKIVYLVPRGEWDISPLLDVEIVSLNQSHVTVIGVKALDEVAVAWSWSSWWGQIIKNTSAGEMQYNVLAYDINFVTIY